MNLQDCAWENHCRIITKTILQEEETIHCNITIWKIPAAKAAVDKEMGETGKDSGVGQNKVRSKNEVIDEARTKVPFSSWLLDSVRAT